MNEITPFTFPATGQAVRSVAVAGEPWFVARDVCDVLDIKDVSMAVRSLDEDERGTSIVGTRGGAQEMSVVSEAGLYSLILRSRKPEARVVTRWVTHEVMPALRKTGAYSMAATPVRVEMTINALAELAHDEHVVPVAGRILAFKRWHKPRRGIEAFVQLSIDLNLPGIGGGTTNTKALPEGGAR
jgi:prophage antirepressor-like protein